MIFLAALSIFAIGMMCSLPSDIEMLVVMDI
jgi:hypothetical protein